MPAIILIVGISLAIWAARHEGERSGQMRDIVRNLCLAAARGEDLAGHLPTEDGSIDDMLGPRLRVACKGADERPEALEVIIKAGDASGFSDGATTHTAIIRFDGRDRLGLRLAERDGRPVIVGFWQPAVAW